jgi:hypothetical protein
MANYFFYILVKMYSGEHGISHTNLYVIKKHYLV